MFKKLIMLFILVPILELIVLIQLGEHIGVGFTLLLIVTSGFAGVTLARHQGFLVLGQLQQRLSQGEMPTDEIIDGLLILVGALLLITPGLITDLTGFFILIPSTRKYFRKLAKATLWGYLVSGKTRRWRIR
ncbi:MAG: FxsA family protein [Bacillota bacterium]